MFSFDKNLLTIPFFLTTLRIILIPFLIWALLVHQWNAALCLFTLAAMSDVLDGAFARLFNEETQLGAYLDPIGDKLLTLVTFGILAFDPITSFFVPQWLFYTILTKEILLILGAVYLMHTKPHCVIHAGWAGKLAMLLQTTFIFVILLAFFAGQPITNLHSIALVHYCLVASLIIALLYYGHQLLQCKNMKSSAIIIIVGLLAPAMMAPAMMDAKKSDFIIKQEQPVKAAPKRSLNQTRQEAADQLEAIAHNLVHEIEAASSLLHDVMHSIRTIAEGDTKKGTVAYLKHHQDDCLHTLNTLEESTRTRAAHLKTKHVWFEEAVFSCNLNTLSHGGTSQHSEKKHNSL